MRERPGFLSEHHLCDGLPPQSITRAIDRVATAGSIARTGKASFFLLPVAQNGYFFFFAAFFAGFFADFLAAFFLVAIADSFQG
ncbi:MAG: hypothetical protein N2544_12140 [Burkholderiales bacterium]|nr:hypothetical protein [Burkholderiales bacterium]